MTHEASNLIFRRKPLDDEMWSDRKGLELAGIIALVQRIREYWDISTLSPYFVIVPADDQGLYDTFISDLSFLIERGNISPELREMLLTSIPATFIDSNLALVWDEEIAGLIKDDFTRALSALRRESMSVGAFDLHDDRTGLFDLFDDELRIIKESNIESTREAEIKFGFRKRPDELSMLSAKLESLEISLRACIAASIENEWKRVPKDIRDKALQRITKEQKRNPRLKVTKVLDKLSYCDLGDLESIIIYGVNWPMFEKMLGPKPELRNRFTMLSPYRNSKAHHRDPDQIAIDDAKSAITWFTLRLN